MLDQRLARWHRHGHNLQMFKTALAAGLAWYFASVISRNHYPYFAALGAIFTVQVTILDSVQKALYRVVGIIGGVVVSLLIGHFLPLDAGSIALVVFTGMAISTLMRLNPQITTQVAISSLLVLAFQSTSGYAVDRIIETVVGCFIALIINIVMIPPNVVAEAEERILHLGQRSTTVLLHLAIGYQEQSLRPVDLPYVQDLVHYTERSLASAKLAQQSLRYSPFLKHRNLRFVAISNTISRLEHITIQIRGIARGLVDLGRDAEPDQDLIESMNATAPCVALYVAHMVHPSEDGDVQLKMAIKLARETQTECLIRLTSLDSLTTLRDMFGILTDLNRILEEVNDRPLIVTGREFT